MYETVASPDDFQCSWLKEQMTKGIENILWSPPYADSSGHAVVACWLPLRTVQGEERGVVGFELCYHKLRQSIIQKVQEEELVKVIVTSQSPRVDGRLIDPDAFGKAEPQGIQQTTVKVPKPGRKIPHDGDKEGTGEKQGVISLVWETVGNKLLKWYDDMNK